MTKEDAIAYCYKHRNKYIADNFAMGEDGVEQFDCLISILESGHIKPEQLAEYGMEYNES